MDLEIYNWFKEIKSGLIFIPMAWVSKALLYLIGWRIVNGIPDHLKKYIVVVAPHTSWKDVVLGMLVRSAIKRDIHYLAKKELFDSPAGFFFRWTGGKPVDRKSGRGHVEQVVRLFNEHEEFAIAIAPEGTRKKVSNLKSGFYHMAKMAGVPIVPCLLDYEHKQVRFLEPYYVTDDVDMESGRLWEHFINVKGAHPEKSIYGEMVNKK